MEATYEMGPVIEIADSIHPWDTACCRNPYMDSADEISSFTEYCQGHIARRLLERLRDAVSCRRVKVGKVTALVPRPVSEFVTDAHIVKMELVRGNEHLVHISTVLCAQIALLSNTRISDTVEQWYRVGWEWDTRDGPPCLANQTPFTIYDKRDRRLGQPLSEYLIPLMSRAEQEREAERILECYYPEALEKPSPVMAQELATRLGLTVQYAQLKGSALGQLHFDTGTILVDSRIADNAGRVANTIIHECVHKLEHELFFQLQKLYNSELKCLSLQVEHIPSDTKSPLYWIEQQANRLTPRISMPEKQARAKIEELREKFSVQQAFIELARFYGVSVQAAKIRMAELGYEVPTQKVGRTFTIGLREAVAEYARNDAFRKKLDSGRYLYINGYFCRNEPRYVRKDQRGQLHLSAYGLQNIEACCLSFALVRKGYPYQEGVLYRQSGEWQYMGTAYMEEAIRLTEILPSLPVCFASTLVAHMQRLGFTLEMLEERTTISSRTLSRIRNEEDYPITIKQLVALCIGLQLEPELSDDLIRKAGFTFRSTQEHIVYKVLLRSMYKSSIAVCNQILQAEGMQPLIR